MKHLKSCFIPVYSNLLKSEQELQNKAGEYFDVFTKYKIKRLKANEDFNTDILFIFVVTGGTEQQILNTAKKRTQLYQPKIYLVAYNYNNSLPSCLESLAKLKEDNINAEIIYFNSSTDALALNKLKEINSKVKTRNQLKYRVGIIGQPSDWLVASVPDYNIIKQRFGLDLIDIEIDEIKHLIKDVKKDEIEDEYKTLTQKAEDILEPNSSDIETNLKVYVALRKIVDKYSLDSITIRCFDLLFEPKTTGCTALSLLNDNGIIAGCEGDINSLIGMLIIKNQFNQLAWMANPSQINIKQNSLWLAHCTVPLSLIENYTLHSHFESGIGVGIKGQFAKSDITLLRIGGKLLNKIWIAEGKIINTGNSEHLCRTQIEVELQNNSVTELLSNPLGNHLLVVKSHIANNLIEWWNNSF